MAYMLFFYMAHYPLRYLPSNHVFIDPADDCDKLVDALLEADYCEDFCLAQDFEEDFLAHLMESGFLVMSAAFPPEPSYILLPKLHLERSVLLFPELRIKKSIRRFLPLYELCIDCDFDFILDKCIQTHGGDWLTPPLVGLIKDMRQRKDIRAKPVSFAVCRNGEIKAGEIGVAVGRVYTSYSGYYEEDNAGTAQIILMAQWLEKTGFDFLDLGMPLDYKTALGARNIEPGRFVELFRAARY
jgi:Leu/Phe-tRNA-protein transferase